MSSRFIIPDVLAIAPLYKDWFSRGEGLGNFLSYGDYSSGNEKDPNTFLFPRGAVFGRDLSTVHPVDPAKVTEFVSHSWYEYSSGDDDGKHPYQGETNPKYTGPKPPYDQLDVDKKYSWLKAPRYDGKPMEVGPLARMVVGYAAGQKEIREAVDGVLKKLNAPADGALFDPRPDCGPRAGIAIDGGAPGGLGGTARLEPGSRQGPDLQSHPVGPQHVAELGDRLRLA